MTTTRYLLFLALFFFSTFFSLFATADTTPQRAVLVTGASSGLGLKMTETLSANGFVVYAGVRNSVDAKRVSQMENVEALVFDVTKPRQIAKAVRQVENKGRGLYGLVNNAGVAVFGPLLEVGVEQLEFQMDVNVYGPYRVTQAFAPLIIESKGRIATTGSVAGISSAAMYGIYAMSKHAIEAYTDSLAEEMARFGVKVSVVEPGNYSSNIGNNTVARMKATRYWPKNTQYLSERSGFFDRLPQVEKGKDPQDVANAVLHIMQSDSPKRRYMVTPNAAQAERTLRANLRKTLQLNQDQAYSFDLDTLSRLLREEATELEPKENP